MKLVPLILTGVIVMGYNIVAQAMCDIGESSTQRIVISGILAIVIYEVANYYYKRYKKNQTDKKQ